MNVTKSAPALPTAGLETPPSLDPGSCRGETASSSPALQRAAGVSGGAGEWRRVPVTCCAGSERVKLSRSKWCWWLTDEEGMILCIVNYCPWCGKRLEVSAAPTDSGEEE